MSIAGRFCALYDEAMARHYGSGPPSTWPESFISAYASMHPWEDWAETWAHYLHMVDTLDTAKSHGLTLRVPGRPGPARVSTDALGWRDFEALAQGWQAVTWALNDLNRSMGLGDVYPFVLSPAVQEKLRFVHELISRWKAGRRGGEPPSEPPPPAPAPGSASSAAGPSRPASPTAGGRRRGCGSARHGLGGLTGSSGPAAAPRAARRALYGRPVPGSPGE